MTRHRLMGARELQTFVRDSLIQRKLAPPPSGGPARIVVAYAQDEAAPLFDWASQFGRAFHSSLWLAHVVSPPVRSLYGPELLGADLPAADDESGHAHQVLESAAQGMRSMGIPSQVRVVQGTGAAEVGDIAQEVQADLIMVGAPHHSALARVTLGSFAEALLKKLPCDLLQIRGTAKPTNILVAVDASPESGIAVRKALAVAKPLGARVAILHSMDVDEVQDAQLTDPRVIAWEGVPDRIDGVNVTYHLVVGPAAQATAEFAQRHNIDLIFVGTRHERGWRRLAHGSVAAGLAHATRSSLWIVAPS